MLMMRKRRELEEWRNKCRMKRMMNEMPYKGWWRRERERERERGIAT